MWGERNRNAQTRTSKHHSPTKTPTPHNLAGRARARLAARSAHSPSPHHTFSSRAPSALVGACWCLLMLVDACWCSFLFFFYVVLWRGEFLAFCTCLIFSGPRSRRLTARTGRTLISLTSSILRPAAGGGSGGGEGGGRGGGGDGGTGGAGGGVGGDGGGLGNASRCVSFSPRSNRSIVIAAANPKPTTVAAAKNKTSKLVSVPPATIFFSFLGKKAEKTATTTTTRYTTPPTTHSVLLC